jgi:hypothetical protein
LLMLLMFSNPLILGKYTLVYLRQVFYKYQANGHSDSILKGLL